MNISDEAAVIIQVAGSMHRQCLTRVALNDSDVHFDVVGAEQVEGTAASHTADHRSSRSRVDGESAKAEGGLHGDEQISQRGTELCRRVLASIR